MNSRFGSLLLSALALAVLTASVPAANAAPIARGDQDVAHAKSVLPGAQQGRKALKSMDAGQEAAAAERNHRSVESFRKLVTSDPTIWVSTKGLIFYVEHADASDVGSAQQSTRRSSAWATFPESQTFLLHSKAGSERTIYLDFDGYTLALNKAWTDPTVNGKIIPAGAYGGFSLDGNAAFDSAELSYVQTVWRIMAEKYAAFDVDVTTEAPSSDALNRTSDSDTTYGTRVVITNDMAARGTVCTASASGGCIGIAWVDVFNAVDDDGYGTDGLEPAWVYTRFTSGTSDFSAGMVANVAAHETGHTLGLSHDTPGPDCGGYSSGHDDWFPIMGSSWRAVGHFTNGFSYEGEPTTCQTDPVSHDPNPDDLDVIGKAGAPLRADDVGGTKALGQAASYSVDGIIGRGTSDGARDADTYSVDRSCSGPLTATASGVGLGQSLDLKVRIRNAVGVQVASAAPETSADTSTDPNTPVDMDAEAVVPNAGSGVWTVTVEGVGSGDPETTGYPDYGSLGMYHLAISGCAPPVNGAFASVNPSRLLDTRNGIGAPKVQVGAGQSVTFQVAGRGGVPAAGASAAVLNLTVTKGTKAGVITAYAAGTSKPTTSNVSFVAGQTIATHATVRLGTDGKVTLFNSSAAPVDLIADVLGWYDGGTVSAPGMFTPVVPTRLANLATAGPNVTLPVAVSGKAGIPAAANVRAGVFNVTATAPTQPGYITAFPNGTSRPNASNVNFLAGQTIANAATTRLVNGNLSLFNGSLGTTRITADVSGWFTAGAATDPGAFVPVNPARILDTRNGIGATRAQVPAGGTLALTVAGAGGVPASGADAVVMNATVAKGTASGYVTAYPFGTSRPNASNINFVAGQTIPNLVTVRLGSGKVIFYNGSTKPVDVLADVAGWYRG